MNSRDLIMVMSSLLSMAAAVESGGQAVLMAPTEILARQHFATISKLADAAGVTVDILTGRTKGREREAMTSGNCRDFGKCPTQVRPSARLSWPASMVEV